MAQHQMEEAMYDLDALGVAEVAPPMLYTLICGTPPQLLFLGKGLGHGVVEGTATPGP